MNQDLEAAGSEDKKPSSSLRKAWKPMVVAALWLLCLAWYMLQPSPEHVENVYSRWAYRIIASVITPITGAVPFSIALLVFVAGPLVFLALWIANWVYRQKVKGMSRWRGLIWGPKWLLVIVPIVWLWFLLFWGMGYARLPVETRLNFDDGTVSEAELRQIKGALLQIILQNAPSRPEDRDIGRAVAAVAQAMQDAVSEWEGGAIHLPGRVKATPPGLLMMNGTSGVCVPFTLEPHVDGGLPDTAFVFVAAHELGHIAGVCDEGETNLLGYIAGLRAKNPFAQYAVALDVYLDVVRQLPSAERKTAIKQLPEQARQDLQRIREAQERYRIDWFQKWSWRAYNQYLKSQGVQEGVRSYGRGTQLLVKAWRAGYFDFPEVPDAAGESGPPAAMDAPDGQL